MRLYSAPMPAPNPRRVRMFAAEKGIALDEVMLDLRRREHKSPDHLARNSLGQVPVLESDDGAMIAESVAICRYLDAIVPEPAMFGRTPVEVATVDMWLRRIEIQLGEPVKLFWRHAHPATAALVDQHRAFGEASGAEFQRSLSWLDSELSDRRRFLTSDAPTMVDIAATTIIDFATVIGLDSAQDHARIADWHARMAARPSYTA